MDCCVSISRSSITEYSLATVVKNQVTGSQISVAKAGCSSSSRKSTATLRFKKAFHVLGAVEAFRHLNGRQGNQPWCYVIKSEGGGSRCFTTPFQPSSPEGKLLGTILRKPYQRHLFQFAMSEQLEELVSHRDQVAELKRESSGSMEAVLNRRIAEMKEKECQSAVEDVMYMSIAHKFLEADLPMVGKLSECINENTLDICPSKCKEFESIHSLEVQEMVNDHLVTILSMRKRSAVEGLTTTKISKLHLGRIYAASIMFAYFLKSACFRRQMNTRLTRPQRDLQTVGHGADHSATEQYRSLQESLEIQYNSVYQESPSDPRHENLKTYVEGFDSETLQRCAKLKSKEAENVITKQTWAIFGDETICQNDTDSKIIITFSSLERLVLEAVGYGSFLWDVEKSVDSVYALAKN